MSWIFKHNRLESETDDQSLTYLDQCRYDHLHRLINDFEAVGVIQAHYVCSHEGEDWHDVMEDFLLQEEEETKMVNFIIYSSHKRNREVWSSKKNRRQKF